MQALKTLKMKPAPHALATKEAVAQLRRNLESKITERSEILAKIRKNRYYPTSAHEKWVERWLKRHAECD